MMDRWTAQVGRHVLVPLVTLSLAGCSGSGPTPGSGPDGGGPQCVLPVALSITPPMATLVSRNGSAPTAGFTVMGTFLDGSRQPVTDASWSSSDAAIGTVSTAGVFTATGNVGGREVLTASVMCAGGTVSATADVTVMVADSDTSLSSSDAPSLFTGTAAPATDLPIDYPLDGAYLPQNLPPLDVQWENAMPGDVYDVRFVEPFAAFDGYVTVPASGFKDDYVPSTTMFHAIERSSDGKTPVILSVTRYRAGATPALVVSAPVALTFTLASVGGRVYYWNLGAGQIDVIAPDAASRSPLGYAPPASGGSACIACHTVSRDGKRLEAEFYDGFTGPAGILDLTATPIAATVSPAPSPIAFNSITSAFSPDGSRLIGVSDAPINAPRLELIDASDGSSLPVSLPAFDASYPDWSPLGTEIVFAGDQTSLWPNGLYYQGADLFSIPLTSTGLFGGATMVVSRRFDGSTTENAIYAPTFSPDGKLVAFGRGAYSDSCGSDCLPGANPPPSQGNLYLYEDGSSSPPQPLAKIGAPGVNYLPRFSPFNLAGYDWLVFFSRRDYGNALAGTKGAMSGSTPAHRRQIWITAIDAAPSSGVDPSHAPYWLPGQDVTSDNMSAYWAYAPIR